MAANMDPDLLDRILASGIRPDEVVGLDGNWPFVAAPIRARNGELHRELSNWFDVFLPTRSVTLVETTGGYQRRQFAYRPGMVGFGPPDESWSIEWLGWLEGFVVIIAPEVLERAAAEFLHAPLFADGSDPLPEESPMDTSTIVWRGALGDHYPALAHLGIDLVAQLIAGAEAPQRLVEMQAQTFHALLARRYSRVGEHEYSRLGMRHPGVLRALAYIEQHLADELSVSKIADACGISQGHVNKIFRAETGKSVWAYIRDTRLDRAAEALRRRDLPIGSVARHCGFRSRTTFSNVFKERFGMSPRAYEKKH